MKFCEVMSEIKLSEAPWYLYHNEHQYMYTKHWLFISSSVTVRVTEVSRICTSFMISAPWCISFHIQLPCISDLSANRIKAPRSTAHGELPERLYRKCPWRRNRLIVHNFERSMPLRRRAGRRLISRAAMRRAPCSKLWGKAARNGYRESSWGLVVSWMHWFTQSQRRSADPEEITVPTMPVLLLGRTIVGIEIPWEEMNYMCFIECARQLVGKHWADHNVT
jgi:hypothetical protein